MGNRHAHKKLRREVRARMALTGESYQAARGRVVGGATRPLPRAADVDDRGATGRVVDLIATEVFGVRVVVATFAIAQRLGALVVSNGCLGGAPMSPLRALGSRSRASDLN